MRTPDGRQTGWWTRPHPDLVDVADSIFENVQPEPMWRGGTLDLDALERFDETITAAVREPYWQQALEFRQTLEDKREMWLDHARVRQAIANYFEHTVYPSTRFPEYLKLAGKLREARGGAFWGVDPMECDRPVVQWWNRVGQVKLCPDDAREDQQRAARLYSDRIVALGEAGLMIRFAVFTFPNAPQWHLAASADAIMRRFRDEIVYGRVDGRVARSIKDTKRRFPHLLGAWACLESPLSARAKSDPGNAWNVHLNVMMVFEPDPTHPKGYPNYEAIDEAWGSWVKMYEVQAGSKDATHAAIRELIKYPLKAVSKKTAEKRDAGATDAPPLIEWPPEFFHEWWLAHKGMRRTRTWGCLYNASMGIEQPKRNPNLCDWLGRIILTPAECDISWPLPDLNSYSARAIAHRTARAAEVSSIQGNKFADGSAPFGKEYGPRGPPP